GRERRARAEPAPEAGGLQRSDDQGGVVRHETMDAQQQDLGIGRGAGIARRVQGGRGKRLHLFEGEPQRLLEIAAGVRRLVRLEPSGLRGLGEYEWREEDKRA